MLNMSDPRDWRKAISFVLAALLAVACVIVAWVMLGAVVWFAKWVVIGLIAWVLFVWARRQFASRRGDSL